MPGNKMLEPIFSNSNICNIIFRNIFTRYKFSTDRLQQLRRRSRRCCAGKKIFKKCRACYQLGENAKNSTGPVLTRVIGRQVGSFKGYKYGRAMKKAGGKGLVWNEQGIFDYILNPGKYLHNCLGEKKPRQK